MKALDDKIVYPVVYTSPSTNKSLKYDCDTGCEQKSSQIFSYQIKYTI